MPPFAILSPTGARDLGLCRIDRHDFDLEPVEKKIQLAAGDFAAASLQHNGRFQSVGSRKQACAVLADFREKGLALRLTKKNSE